MTKPDELLKYIINENVDTQKVELTQHFSDNTLHIHTPNYIQLNAEEIVIQPKKRVVKTKTTTKSQIEKVTSQLYNIENCNIAEKTLNIDLDLYQMENY